MIYILAVRNIHLNWNHCCSALCNPNGIFNRNIILICLYIGLCDAPLIKCNSFCLSNILLWLFDQYCSFQNNTYSLINFNCNEFVAAMCAYTWNVITESNAQLNCKLKSKYTSFLWLSMQILSIIAPYTPNDIAHEETMSFS